jgi:hypothetical protein
LSLTGASPQLRQRRLLRMESQCWCHREQGGHSTCCLPQAISVKWTASRPTRLAPRDRLAAGGEGGPPVAPTPNRIGCLHSRKAGPGQSHQARWVHWAMPLSCPHSQEFLTGHSRESKHREAPDSGVLEEQDTGVPGCIKRYYAISHLVLRQCIHR